MTLHIQLEAEGDGRWMADVPALPGVMTYGQTREEALARVQALALRTLAEQVENGERPGEVLNVAFEIA
jgi:predicted RNase H-like HicB family nuclease